LSREHISFIKDENVQLKAENAYLKKELENATLVMSHLNEHVKLMGEEKQSLITALKILQNNEIDDGRNKIWHIASDRKQQKVPQFKPIEVSSIN
jgi:type IV secretory pathway VirB9-like protein